MKFMQKSILGFLINVGFTLTIMIVTKAFTSEIQPEAPRAENPGIRCELTPAYYLGPFYKASAPVRSSVGKGYHMTGMVMSSGDCTPIAKAAIELWLAGLDGNYDDDHRASLYPSDSGQYRFKRNRPPGCSGRPPDIHIRVSANGMDRG